MDSKIQFWQNSLWAYGLALASVFILIPVVNLFSYTEIFEEVFKAAIIFFFVAKFPTKTSILIGSVLVGFLFGLSENILYVYNSIELGGFDLFFERFLWTVPLHMVTSFVLGLSVAWSRFFIIFGLFLAILIHYAYNLQVII